MIERFQGSSGRPSLITALMEQILIHGDRKLAEVIADKAALKELAVGVEIIQQGGADTDIYFIVSGSASIVINGRVVNTRGTGDHVGEMALIDPTEKRSATVRTTELSVVAMLTEEDFSAVANQHPQLWRRIAVALGDRLRQRSKSIRQPNGKPMVFIGSSKEMLKIGELVKAGIKSDSIDVKLWSDGIFEVSATTIESLCAIVETYDFGVIVFGPDDSITSRGVEKFGPRDNAVFELGLANGGFGRKRTFILKPAGLDIKVPSDLLGVICIDFDEEKPEGDGQSIKSVCDMIRDKVMVLGPR